MLKKFFLKSVLLSVRVFFFIVLLVCTRGILFSLLCYILPERFFLTWQWGSQEFQLVVAHHFFRPTLSVGAQWVPFNTSPKIRGCLGTHGTHADYAPEISSQSKKWYLAEFLRSKHFLVTPKMYRWFFMIYEKGTKNLLSLGRDFCSFLRKSPL